MLVRQRTQLMNATRSLLGELGIVAAQGTRGFAVLCGKLESADAAIPPVLLPALRSLVEQWRAVGQAADKTRRPIMKLPYRQVPDRGPGRGRGG